MLILLQVDDIAVDGVCIVFQTGEGRRSTTRVTIRSFDPMSKATEAYTKLKGAAPGSLRFSFDGEDLQGTETPKELDMDDEAVVDVFTVNL